MEPKPYIFIIDVSALAPKGVKVLNKTLRGVGVAEIPNARAVLEERDIEQAREAYAKEYPGIPMRFTAKSTRIHQQFLIVEDGESEAQTDTKNEQPEQTEQ